MWRSVFLAIAASAGSREPAGGPRQRLQLSLMEITPGSFFRRADPPPKPAMLEVMREQMNFTIFYETLCPDSQQFFFMQLEPLQRTNPDLFAKLKLAFVPYGNTHKDGVSCQHGPVECYGNALHRCALAQMATPTEFLAFAACHLRSLAAAPANMQEATVASYATLCLNDEAKSASILACAGDATKDSPSKNAALQLTAASRVGYVPYMLLDLVEVPMDVSEGVTCDLARYLLKQCA